MTNNRQNKEEKNKNNYIDLDYVDLCISTKPGHIRILRLYTTVPISGCLKAVRSSKC